VGVVVLTYLAGKLIYRLRDVILLMVVGGFIALILNPFVLFAQRRIPRRGTAVAIITVWADAPRLRACQALSMVHG
jgi:predicted PurR-regulated permease PerM